MTNRYNYSEGSFGIAMQMDANGMVGVYNQTNNAMQWYKNEQCWNCETQHNKMTSKWPVKFAAKK
ncbi:MAG: hypothetical protein PHT58_07550 [Eubacteriales bacterium]|nr:hypothetical protein [Eubacteriales bacterium]